jgi:hypothetical protein
MGRDLAKGGDEEERKQLPRRTRILLHALLLSFPLSTVLREAVPRITTDFSGIYGLITEFDAKTKAAAHLWAAALLSRY